ncbi:MAG: hypothetical protein Q8O21_00855, partial [bacterium]|nr:hypothetical protein [bacterium]
AERGIAQAMAAEMNIKVVELSGSKDPDECIKQNPDEWRNAVTQAKPMMQYYFDKTFAGLDLDRVESKREAAKILLPVIAKLGNMIERDFWLKKLSQKVDVAENYLREALGAAKGRQSAGWRTPKDASYPNTANNPDISARQSREEKLSELLLALMLKFPSLIEYAANYISGDQIGGSANRRIYRNLIIYYNKTINDRAQEEINYQDFKNWLEQNNQTSPQSASEEQFLGRLMLLADKDFYNYSQEQAQNEIIKIAAILKRRYLAGRLKEITKLIAQIEKENQSDERLKGLMEEFKALSEEIQEVEC